jgi:putative spermidine/putrescine transport system ATP-binding protein
MTATHKSGIAHAVEDPILRLSGISKRFSGHQAVADVSLSLAKGKLLTLLGPSGCGKSTLLRMVAGFEQPTAGAIEIQGQDVTRWNPERRPTAMVFQSYALFPHLTVFENVAFGLRLRKRSAGDIDRQVKEVLGLIRMESFVHRYPSELSGGQQQRVALARCLVIEPQILLLDEPLGALDRTLREQMQVELRKLQKQIGITMLVVTHDQEEAFVLSDYVAVMNAGRIEQYAAPTELYDKPASQFVARFMGIPNLLKGTVAQQQGQLRFRLGSNEGIGFPLDSGVAPGTAVVVALRPETLRLVAPQHADAHMQGDISFTSLVGSKINCEVAVGGETLCVSVPRGPVNPAVGDRVGIVVDPLHATALLS